MSQRASRFAGIVESDETPVTVSADSLESLDPSYLFELKEELRSAERVPAALTVDVAFDGETILEAQAVSARVRACIEAANNLDAGQLKVTVTETADEERSRIVMQACRERATREGVLFEVEWP